VPTALFSEYVCNGRTPRRWQITAPSDYFERPYAMKRLFIELAQAAALATMMFAAFIIYFWRM
jgi:hypothetical protein